MLLIWKTLGVMHEVALGSHLAGRMKDGSRPDMIIITKEEKNSMFKDNVVDNAKWKKYYNGVIIPAVSDKSAIIEVEYSNYGNAKGDYSDVIAVEWRF